MAIQLIPLKLTSMKTKSGVILLNYMPTSASQLTSKGTGRDKAAPVL
jgi:hypothetical protein